MNKKIIITLVVVLVLLIGCILYLYKDKIMNALSTNESTMEVTDSDAIMVTTTSDTEMDSDIDWSKYSTTNVTLDGDYTITSGGIYSFTGSTSDGSIIVNTTDNVKIILNGVEITSSDSPAINVVNAKNVYIELNGTNTLSSTTTS